MTKNYTIKPSLKNANDADNTNLCKKNGKTLPYNFFSKSLPVLFLRWRYHRDFQYRRFYSQWRQFPESKNNE